MSRPTDHAIGTKVPVDNPLAPCSHAIANVCQSIAVDPATHGWDALDGFSARFADIPPPATYGGAIAAAGVLMHFVGRLGERAHQRWHQLNGPGNCAFSSATARFPAAISPAEFRTWSVRDSVQHWVDRYLRAFTSAHDVTAEHAKMLIDRHVGGRLTNDVLARALGCSGSVLVRKFEARYGCTPMEFQSRRRAIQIVRLIRTEHWALDDIAREVGWMGRKDLYRTLRAVTGLSPAGVRALSGTETDRLLTHLGH